MWAGGHGIQQNAFLAMDLSGPSLSMGRASNWHQFVVTLGTQGWLASAFQ